MKKIKLGSTDLSTDTRILREVSTLSRLQHPHIVRYYQAWVEEAPAIDSEEDEEEEDEEGEWGRESSGAESSGALWALEEESAVKASAAKHVRPADHTESESEDVEDARGASGYTSGSEEGEASSSDSDSDASDSDSEDGAFPTARKSPARGGGGGISSLLFQRPSSSSTSASSSESSSSVGNDSDAAAGSDDDDDSDSSDSPSASSPSRPTPHGPRDRGPDSLPDGGGGNGDRNATATATRSGEEPANASSSPRHVLYIQMEYCPKNLRDVLDARELDSEAAWEVLRQILEGLAHIHAQGMIHRDLKPANIFKDARGDIKLGDFGLAKFQVGREGRAQRSTLRNPYACAAMNE